MRFLVDQSVSYRIAESLQTLGHDAVHVRNYGMRTAKDADILTRAEQEDRIIISADTDFDTLLAQRMARRPSVIIFRGSKMQNTEEQIKLLTLNVAKVDEDLQQGSIIIIEESRIRVRRLPIT